MFNALRLSDPGVKAARRHEAIVGKKVTARGAFSAVFDNGDTVLKLTLDQHAYLMACDQVIGVEGPHFTRLVYNHGDVGEVDGHALNLFECEKLAKLPRTGAARDLARKICRLAGDHTRRHMSMRRMMNPSHLAVEELSMDEALPESIRDAFSDLHRYGHYTDNAWTLDMHSANLMVRPADGTLVISDPIADRRTERSLMLKRRGLAH